MLSNISSPSTLFLSEDGRRESYQVDYRERGEKMAIKVAASVK
jgi:hypothetical protein